VTCRSGHQGPRAGGPIIFSKQFPNILIFCLRVQL
jgi:hypothetical protein